MVPDTSVLIDLFRDAAVAEAIERQHWRFRISAVVHSELVRGAEGPLEQRYVRALERNFPPIEPTAAEWARCGELLRRLRREHHFDRRGLQSIQNDVLIALTARGLGLPVVTANVGDFALVARHLRGLTIVRFPIA